MADEEQKEEVESKPVEQPAKSPMLLIIAMTTVLLIVGAGFFLMQQSPSIDEAKPVVEYVVKEQMFQLKDGSYLRLGFSIVVEEDKFGIVKDIVEKGSPGKLPNGINMIVGNKSREDLINGTHKREAFSRELKKMLEERVFEEFNKKQRSTQDTIEVKEILFSVFVTQSG